MGTLGLCVTICMPWLAPLFASGAGASFDAVCMLGILLAGPAMLFQTCDGWKLASNCCLMGVGDVRVPAVLASALAWLLWVPAAYLCIFGLPGGWAHVLPEAGLGASGGAVGVGAVLAPARQSALRSLATGRLEALAVQRERGARVKSDQRRRDRTAIPNRVACPAIPAMAHRGWRQVPRGLCALE